MITITLFIHNKTLELQASEGQTIKTLLDSLNREQNTWITHTVAARVNNQLCSLSEPLTIHADLEPVFITSPEGSATYRRSLCFLLAAAANSVFPGNRLTVGHSLGHGYYYTLETPETLTQNDLDKLENKMRQLVKKDAKITQRNISYKEAVALFESLNLSETRMQLNYRCPPLFTVNSLEDFSDLYFAPLIYSTGILQIFELRKYAEGFLLRFPPTSDPGKLLDFEDVPRLFAVYQRYKDWGKLLNVTSAASLNKLVYDNNIKDFVNVTETLQNKCFADTADAIKNRRNVKVVLISGPSSSGKTTSSKKIAMQLQVIGYSPKIISLDDYYIGRELTPKDENGNYDYECLEALDIEQLNDDLNGLFNGKEVHIPSYNFSDGKRFYKEGKILKLSAHDILILEGIHGLNDRLTPRIQANIKFKMYVSALTQLNLDDHNRIPTSDNRLIRRIVRDYRFRGKSAVETIKMWPNVQKGERLHIFPFQDKADAMLNTALDYELPVLKTYAEPILRCVTPLQSEYSEASRLLGFLNNFSPIPSNLVPGQSIIREFIGDSEFKY